MNEDDMEWHLLLEAPHTWYTRYCQEVEVHWLTRLFVAHAIKLKDDDQAVLLMELSELREDMDTIKEVVHQLARKFKMWLFLVRVDNHGTLTPPTTPVENTKAVLGKPALP